MIYFSKDLLSKLPSSDFMRCLSRHEVTVPETKRDEDLFRREIEKVYDELMIAGAAGKRELDYSLTEPFHSSYGPKEELYEYLKEQGFTVETLSDSFTVVKLIISW